MIFYVILDWVYYKANNSKKKISDKVIDENTYRLIKTEFEKLQNQINDLREKESQYNNFLKTEKEKEIQKTFPVKIPDEELNRVHLDDVTKKEVENLIFKIKKDNYLKVYLPGKNRTLCKYISLEGAPGTGKTMLAEAIAKEIGKNIIVADYQKISSKYVGETEKRLEKLFSYAAEQNAVLFIDEADSLLSTRISNAQSATDIYVNSTRNAVLTSLNNYSGIVIFASNFTENYDSAINSRIIKISLNNSLLVRYGIWFDQLENLEEKLDDLPDIYKQHYAKLFSSESTRSLYSTCLAWRYAEFSGRDIRKIVEDVLVEAVRKHLNNFPDDLDNFHIDYETFEDVCKNYPKKNNSLKKVIDDLMPIKDGIVKIVDEVGLKGRQLRNQNKQEKLLKDKKNIANTKLLPTIEDSEE